MKQIFFAKKNKHFWLVLLVIGCTVIIQLIGLWRFNTQLHRVSVDYSMRQIEEMAEYVKSNIQSSINHHIHALEMIHLQLNLEQPLLSDNTAEQLNQLTEPSKFDTLAVSDPEGNVIDSNGQKYNVIQFELPYKYVCRVIGNNHVYISNVLTKDENAMIAVGISLNEDCTSHEILWGILSLDKLTDHIDFSGDSYKYFQIVDDEGHYLLPSSSPYALNQGLAACATTVWDELEQYQYSDGMSSEALYEMMQKGASGNFYFEGKGQGRYANFCPLDINNWYLFSVQVDDELNSFVVQSRQTMSHYYVLLALGALTIFGTIFFLVYSMYKKIAMQNREIQNVASMFQATLYQTKNTPFIIDHKVGQFIFYAYRSSTATQSYSFDFMHPDNLMQRGILDAESFSAYQLFYQKLVLDKTMCAPMILCLNQNWIRIRIISDDLSSKGQMIGVAEDYDEQKAKDLQIESHLVDIKKIKIQSRLDYLTGIYNREAFLEHFHSAFELSHRNHQTGALMILDLDHFKEINDQLGHGTGDIVLQEIAHILLEFFHSGEIVGRFGGDEFMVYIPNIQTRAALERRIRDLNRLMCRTYQKGTQSISVSASIGIVLTDDTHSDFQTLYNRADLALYYVKNSTRNGYKIYSDPN